MRTNSFLLLVLALAGAVTVKAVPTIDLNLIQDGSDVSLSWCIANPDQNSQGLALYIQSFDPVRNYDTGIFVGYFDSTLGSLSGTIESGWRPLTMNSEGEMVPWDNLHWSTLFSIGEHDIQICYFGDGSVLPRGYSSDGQYGGVGTWLESSYTISAPGISGSSATNVPEGGVTALFLAPMLLAFGLARRIAR